MSDPSTTRIRVPKDLDGVRIDRALEALVGELSAARAQKLVRRGAVRVQGRTLKRSTEKVRTGDVLLLGSEFGRANLSEQKPGGAELEGHGRGSEQPRDSASDPAGPELLFEDEDLLVVYKPAGMVTHPTERFLEGTVADLCDRDHGPLPRLLGEHRPGIVHRLDRETSGIMVLARSEDAMLELQRAFRERRVAKTYLALCHGRVPRDRFTIDAPLGPAGGDPDRQTILREGEGKDARTKVRVLEAFPDPAAPDHGKRALALVRCRPTSGRRHQIRVHLASEDLPIVSDRMYRPDWVVEPPGAPLPVRHALHAATLAFFHPRTGEDLEFEAPLPEDLGTLLAWLREDRFRASEASS